jgi:hypothetical protein
MAALVFPSAPSTGDRYPVNPGTSGVTQYEWDGGKWNAVLNTVSLGIANQGAGVGTNTFNAYNWPATDGTAGLQLTTDGSGNLSWGVSAVTSFTILGTLEPIDGILSAFTLIDAATSTPFTPTPSTNILVFLGGVPQIPGLAYTVLGNTIQFFEVPLVGSTFYAISSTVA